MDRVQLGTISVTPAATAALAEAGLVAKDLLDRFRAGDWGADDPAGRLHCDFCLAQDMPLISWYTLAGGTRIAVACSADRSETLVALASEHGPVEVSAAEGYAAWSRTYDTELNQLIAVEQVFVDRLLGEAHFGAALDAATGIGRHALALARRGAAVTALDASPEMMAVARGRAVAEQLPITFLQASLSQPLPLADGRFDLAICALAFCHLPEIGAPCREFFRVLRTGGRFLLTDFHPDALDSGWHTDFWSGATGVSPAHLPASPHRLPGGG